MRQLALGDGASQCFGHFFLGREVIYRCGAVLLDPELRAAAHGYCCRVDGVLDWRLFGPGALFLRSACAAAQATARAGNIWSAGLADGVGEPNARRSGLIISNKAAPES